MAALSGASLCNEGADQVIALGLWGQEQSVLEQIFEHKQRLDQQEKRLLCLETWEKRLDQQEQSLKGELAREWGTGGSEVLLEDRVRAIEDRLEQVVHEVGQVAREVGEGRNQQYLVLANMSREIEGIRKVDENSSVAPDQTSAAEHQNLSTKPEDLEFKKAQFKEQQVEMDSHLETFSRRHDAHSMPDSEIVPVEDKQAVCDEQPCQFRHKGLKIATHRLKESIWDAFIVQWFCSNQIGSATTVFLFCLNMFIQVAMVYLIFINMSLAHWIEEEELLDLLRWRVGVAHRMEYYHWPSNTSLVTRVCQKDGANILSDSQANTLDLVEKYRIYNKPFNGPMLCIVSLLIWVMSIFRELSEVVDSMFAIMSMKSSEGWFADKQDSNSGSFGPSRRVKYPWRLIMCLLVVLPRLMIAVWLGISGVLFLAQNNEMSELILNCMALGFVLDMDELLYVLVPKHITQALDDAGDIPIETTFFRVFGHDTSLNRLCSDGLWAFLFPLLIVAYVLLLEPVYSKLDLAHAIICGGTQNMVFTKDLSNSVMMYAMTAKLGWDDLSDFKRYVYEPFAVAQTIGLLHHTAGLQPFFAELPVRLASLSDNDAVLAQKTSIQKMDSLERMTVEEAQRRQTCLNVDYNEPARAALSELLGMQSCNMASGDDLQGRCTEPAVRRYCPQRCYCNAVSWWYDRSACPSRCWPEYRSKLMEHIYNQELEHGCSEEVSTEHHRIKDVPFLGGNLTFFSSFVKKELIDNGQLSKHGHPNAAVQTRVKWESANECRLKNDIPMNIEAIVYAGSCLGLMWVDMVFDTRLCNTQERFDRGLQNIAAFCPKSCKVCSWHSESNLKSSLQDYSFMYMLGVRELYGYLEPYLECGYEWIFCGESLNGMTLPNEHYIGNPAAEKVYIFQAQSGIPYSFEAKGSQAIDFSIFAKLSEPPLYVAGLHRMGNIFQDVFINAISKSLHNITFPEAGHYYLMVESSLPHRNIEFAISMSSTDLLFKPTARQQIYCGDSLNASINYDMYFRGDTLPEKIFRFWADPGVEYTFDSCGSSIATSLCLYDEFLRDPKLMSEEMSRQTCSQEDRGHLKWRSKDMGYYHVVIRSPRDEIGDIKLMMNCEG